MAVMRARRFTGSAIVVLASLGGLGAIGCASSQAAALPPTATEHPSRPPQKTIAQRAVDRVEDMTGALPAVVGGSQEEAEEVDESHPVGVPIPGSAFVHGRATVTVNASLEKVRESVLSFGHYAEFMPHYRNAKLLGRTPSGSRDVYMEIEALHGALKMWARIEVAKPETIEGFETYKTKFVEGNVKDFQAVWRMRKVDDQKTELSLEVYLQPTINLPADLQNEENLSGSAKGVKAMRIRAER